MVRFISRNILTGLFTILPVLLILYLLYWLAVSAESVLGKVIRLMLPEPVLARYGIDHRVGRGVRGGVIDASLRGTMVVLQRGATLLTHTRD